MEVWGVLRKSSFFVINVFLFMKNDFFVFLIVLRFKLEALLSKVLVMFEVYDSEVIYL